MRMRATYFIGGREHTEYGEYENPLDFKNYLNNKGINSFVLGEPSWDEWQNLIDVMGACEDCNEETLIDFIDDKIRPN